ncbi:MAG: DUF1549 domain-containing protein, partial [Planctomycetales bacterium]|nr:DUF1549 domain-containing protein [Planctomycetales bacterium]
MSHLSRTTRHWSLLLLLSLLAYAGDGASSVTAQAPPVASDGIDFDSVIQPLLARQCLSCHGADDPHGGLDLTEPHADTLDLVAPGSPSESELLARVSTEDLDERMPPTGPGLSAGEIELLTQWIEQGASWPEHWSYRAITEQPTPLPSSLNRWAQGPLDAGIAVQLERHGLEVVRPASKGVLLRRATYDLWGLPPEPEDVARFERDSRPDAWSRTVDRLLASPRFGERQARHWMDQVHFAETHGHDQDRPRENAWPYRDYLIERFNSDVPYAQFVSEQVAGDALYPDDPWATVGTGLLAAGPWDESSLRDIREDAPDREVARYLDRDDIVTTVMATFAGTSIHCARCHDHKFDPISQADYYGLQAVFAATDKANREIDLDVDVALQRERLASRLARWSSFDPASEDLPEPVDPVWLETRLATVRAQLSAWLSEAPLEVAALGGATTQVRDDHSVLFEGPRPDKDNYRWILPLHVGQLTAVRLEVLPAESLPFSGP